jgi:hypothetical protein
MKFPGLTTFRCLVGAPAGVFWLSSHTMTREAGSRMGSGRRSTVSTTVKMALFAPIPRARVATATSVKPGLRTSMRAP